MAHLLSARNLTKSFGGLVAINNVSFDLTAGETLGIIGPNGAGKSTLFSLLTGFLAPDAGDVIYEDRSIAGFKPAHVCKLGLTRTFQIMQNFPALTTLENVMVGSFLHNKGRVRAQEEAAKVVERVGLGGKIDVLAKDLTMLDQKRLEIAKVLATNPKIILADETMAGLTPVEIREAVGLIRSLREGGITFILIEHVMEVIMSLSDKVLVIHHGMKIAEGKPVEVARDKQVIDAYLGEEDIIV